MAAPSAVYLSGLDTAGLAKLVGSLGMPSYRASQVMEAVWRNRGRDFMEVSTLPFPARRLLAASIGLHPFSILEKRTASDGTVKMLLENQHRQRIETVLIPSRSGSAAGRTVCVSSQTGCPVGCLFCASGTLKHPENLDAASIAGQVLLAHLSLGPVTNVVFMGIGEPLFNADAVRQAVRILQDKPGLALGKRRIVLSTVGCVPGIRRMAAERWPVRLAVSLHAASDALRHELVPGLKYPLAEIIAAARQFCDAVHRTVTIEYVLIAAVNDSAEEVARLAGLLKGGGFKVNLVAYNRVPGKRLKSPDNARVRVFADAVASEGIPVSIRRSFGRGIEAACGQLRAGG